jgi:hypothetical protein
VRVPVPVPLEADEARVGGSAVHEVEARIEARIEARVEARVEEPGEVRVEEPGRDEIMVGVQLARLGRVAIRASVITETVRQPLPRRRRQPPNGRCPRATALR